MRTPIDFLTFCQPCQPLVGQQSFGQTLTPPLEKLPYFQVAANKSDEFAAFCCCLFARQTQNGEAFEGQWSAPRWIIMVCGEMVRR